MSLCTLDNVKDVLGMKGSSEEDGVLEIIIDNVSKTFETHCDRVFDSTEHTEYFDGRGRSWVRPKHYPITSVSGVWDDFDWGWGSDDLVDSSYYRVASDGMFIVLKSTTFVDAEQNVKIIYTAGYTTIPNDLRGACIDEVIRMYKSRTSRHLITYSNTDGENYDYDLNAFSDNTKEILKRYKNK